MSGVLANLEEALKDVRQVTSYRAGGHVDEVNKSLGLLAEFQGNWRGHGFNLIARPAFKEKPPFFLELNGTQETLDFTAVSGDIPNRGSVQPDLMLHGLRYLQQVTDVSSDTGIHIEPGFWIHVPAGAENVSSEGYARLANIPHGDSLVAPSVFFTEVSGGPKIDPVFSIPFTDAAIPGLNAAAAEPLTAPEYMRQYEFDTLPPGLPGGLNAAQTIKDPTAVLRAQIARQTIRRTVVLSISTSAAAQGAIANIPFVVKNANATQMDAIFWVEEVELPSGRIFMQLQYVQRVILDFVGIHWPHISVATLKRL